MLGRVRASPISSLEQLEMERTPSKIIKHDSLSIYESTLLKLKQGSQCTPRCNPEDSTTMDTCNNSVVTTISPEEAITDADCSSSNSISSDSSLNFQSKNEKVGKNMSIHYLFSKYKSSQHANNTKDKEVVMAIDSGYSSSSCSSFSTVSSSSQFTNG